MSVASERPEDRGRETRDEPDEPRTEPIYEKYFMEMVRFIWIHLIVHLTNHFYTLYFFYVFGSDL